MKDKKEKKANTSTKKVNAAVFMKVIAIAAVVTAVSYFLAYMLIVVKPVNDVKKAYDKQTKVLQEIIDRTPAPKVLKTNEELQSLTDDEAFALSVELGENEEFVEQFEGSAEKFLEALLEEYGADIKSTQIIGLADYLRQYCGANDLNDLNMTGALQDYICNVAAVSFFDKAEPAITSYYEMMYPIYNESTDLPDVSSPLQLNEMVSLMATDTELRDELLGSCTALRRVIQSEYAAVKQDYEEKVGASDVINGTFFDLEATSVDDLVDLRMFACDEISVTGYYLPMNISEEDAELIEQLRLEAREALIDCNIRFNMTADGDNVKGIQKLFQKFAVLNVDPVYDTLADYNLMELASHLHSPLMFTEAQTAKYTRDYVFWNLMHSMLTFEQSTALGTPVANINYKAGTLDYGFITGGNPIMDSELDSLLWATAEQTVIGKAYERCELDIDEEGNIVAEDTNDEVVVAYRNLFEAWNLWGSQYTQ